MNNESEKAASRSSRFTMTVAAVCVGLAAIDVGLVLKNRELTDRLAGLSEEVMAAERPPLAEGDIFPTITARDTSGALVPLTSSPTHLATLLLVSSDACDVCQDVRPVWHRLGELATGSHLRVLELVLDVEVESLRGRSAPYPLLYAGDDVWSLTGRVRGVPAAILIDEAGIVRRAFYGQEHDGLAEAVEEVLLLR
jgi:hypothetical protein